MSTAAKTAKGFRTQQDETLGNRKKGSVDRYIILRLLDYIKPFKGLIAGAVALTAGWRLRATFGLPGPDPASFVCH